MDKQRKQKLDYVVNAARTIHTLMSEEDSLQKRLEDIKENKDKAIRKLKRHVTQNNISQEQYDALIRNDNKNV